MSNLIVQIALYLLAATLIGWFIGRSIAKSRETITLNENRDLKEKHASLEEFRDRMNKEYFSLKEREKGKGQEIGLLKKQLTDARVKSETYRLEHYDMKLKMEKQENDAKASIKAQATQSDFSTEREQYRNKINDLTKNISDLSSDKKKHELQLVAMKKAKDKVEVQAQDLSTTEANYHNKLKDMDEVHESMQVDINSLNNEKLDLENNLSKQQTENKNLKDQLFSIKEAQLNADNKVKTASVELEDVTTQMVDLKKQRDDYMGKLDTISSILSAQQKG